MQHAEVSNLRGPMVQLVPLLSLYLLVPSCFSCGLDWCQAGGEYFLPTDWWPECRSCLMTPKARHVLDHTCEYARYTSQKLSWKPNHQTFQVPKMEVLSYISCM